MGSIPVSLAVNCAHVERRRWIVSVTARQDNVAVSRGLLEENVISVRMGTGTMDLTDVNVRITVVVV